MSAIAMSDKWLIRIPKNNTIVRNAISLNSNENASFEESKAIVGKYF
jgi:hypothetical protein